MQADSVPLAKNSFSGGLHPVPVTVGPGDNEDAAEACEGNY